MNAIDTVRAYLDVATPGPKLDPDRVRDLLADDFTHDDPLMGASNADQFVAGLRRAAASGGGGSATVETVVGDDTTVASLTRFRIGDVAVMFSQWFVVRNGRVRSSRVVYDPRPFLAMRG